ncbi:MAG: RNA 2',3'-cyclic phosphodiesterase [Mariprofundaceae bacterium]|nr:RNA 2',3'-cyclic phosphodiesterase [Mariprofundaceae bacterium]
MRLFAAIEVPEDVRQQIAAWWTAASLHFPDGEWRDIPTRNWHITLAFYGDVDGGDVDNLAEKLAVCASETAPMRLVTQDCGIFPRASRPRVFWAGLVSDKQTKDLKYLARCCRRAGHATLRKRTAKERPFRSHITLARAGEFATPLAAEFWQTLPDLPQLAWTASSLILFASRLTSAGAQYRRVEEFIFEGSEYVR